MSRTIDEIRNVLLTVWDPIGVGDRPECSDEYDCCIGGVHSLLANGSTDDELANYLWKQASEHMGLSVSKESIMPTILALRQLNDQRKAELLSET